MGCIFCDIIGGKLPSVKEYEDDAVIAIRDINPKAPVHVIVIPKAHIESAMCVNEGNSALVAHVFEILPELAGRLSLKNGFRVVNNCGHDGAQTVGHMHFHLLGGRALSEDVG